LCGLPKIDAARVVEAPVLTVVQFYVQRREIRIGLFDGARTDDRYQRGRRPACALEEPRHGDLRRRYAGLVCNLEHGVDRRGLHRLVFGVHQSIPVGESSRRAGAILAGEQKKQNNKQTSKPRHRSQKQKHKNTKPNTYKTPPTPKHYHKTQQPKQNQTNKKQQKPQPRAATTSAPRAPWPSAMGRFLPVGAAFDEAVNSS